MANRGMMGAVAGLGQGMMVNAERAAADASAERQSRIDEARDMRLLRAQQAFQAETREDTQKHDVDIIGTETEAQRGLMNDEQSQIATREGMGRAHESEENKLDRESAERIASMRTEGGSDSAAAIEARERFQPRTATITTTGANGFPQEEQMNTIYDKETRQTLIQRGNRFVPQGIDPATVRAAAAPAIDLLLENPAYATQFLEMYNYLPASFMESLPSQRTR